MSQQLATAIVQQLTQAGFIAYWAGGCVRDLLRGVVANDYDVATNATPEQVRQVFGRHRTLAVGESFGVIIVLGKKGSDDKVEVATFREESDYTDGRHPGRVSFCTPEEDAKRRDFTINGMFYDPLTSTVHDFVRGQVDLEKGIVRAIGNPQHRMNEDKLRMLRAVRFASTLNFDLDSRTADAIQGMASEVTVVSAERIAQELRKMLADANRARALQMCVDLRLMTHILPEMGAFTARQKQILQLLTTDRFETVLAALMRFTPVSPPARNNGVEPGSVNGACARLKLSNAETEHVLWLRTHIGRLEQLQDEPLSEFKRLAVHPLWSELVILEQCISIVEEKNRLLFDWIEHQLAVIPPEEMNPPPLLTGGDLLQLGYKAGPNFKRWLIAVRDAQLNCEIHTQAEAIELVGKLASD